MTKPTALIKPEFIANVDTANEEVGRVVDQYNALVISFNEQAAASETLLSEANVSKETAEKNFTELKASTDKEIKDLGEKADKTARDAQAAIAAAGITDPATVKGSNALDADRKTSTEGLTGLARAIAANTAMQAKN